MKPLLRALAVATALALTALVSMAPANAATVPTLGPPQKILGPTNEVDSVYTTFRDLHHVLHAFVSNNRVYEYEQQADGRLVNGRLVLDPGGAGSADQCGAHPVGPFYRDPQHPRHVITFYHAEQAAPVDQATCNHADKHTRWAIRRLSSWNDGRTWHKGAAVITQDTNLLDDPGAGSWNYHGDDAGEPHLVIRGGWLYLIYLAANEQDRSHEESIARAPVSSLGVAGSWRKWYDGSWSQPGLGGEQTALDGLPAGGRAVSYNDYLHRYVAAVVHIGGAALYESTDLLHWKAYSVLWSTGLTGSVWGDPCSGTGEPAAYGYGSIIGYQGSASTSGQQFWVYYMRKPAGTCFDQRYLYRRLVTLP
jgi:hypothetical protein